MKQRCSPLNFSADTLFKARGPELEERLSKMRPETLGRIAAQGKGTCQGHIPGPALYHVHWGTWLREWASGRELLLMIATTAVVAEMTRLLWEKDSANRLKQRA